MPKLYHITKKDNLPSILREGLIPKLSDYTVQIYMDANYEEMRESIDPYDLEFEDDEYVDEYAIEDYIRKQVIRSMTPVVFATEKENIPDVLNNYQNKVRIGTEKLTVLEIKDDPMCAGLFEPRFVNVDYDWVSEEIVPPWCLKELE